MTVIQDSQLSIKMLILPEIVKMPKIDKIVKIVKMLQDEKK